ncbi:P-loop NTPase fold protein [Pseudomonas syringae]|nr:P-loop NTPase fold protein [Pseudomonas syringae]
MDEPEKSQSQNEQIAEYLDHYISSGSSINLAVALTGGWGAGKTHFVKKYLSTKYPEPQDFIYISLFGVASVEEITKSFYRAIYPFLNNKIFKIGSKLTKTTLTMFRFNPTFEISDFKKIPEAKLYVFDDFERCTIPLDTLMGFINGFIEESSSKVLLIINEQEVKERENYLKKKEKIIGITLELGSNVEDAFESFLDSLKEDKSKNIIKKLKREILELYYDSEIKSLRIMQMAMESAERVCVALSDTQCENIFGMRSVLSLVFAWSYELRSGRLSEQDLRSREGFFYTLDPEDKALKDARDRYKGFDICNPILTNDILVSLLIRGYTNSKQIQTSVEASLEFGYANQSSWRVAWHAATVTDEEFNIAFLDIINRFERREYTELEEIIHVLGIMLWSSKIEYTNTSLTKIKNDFFKYIDDLFSKNLLTPLYSSRDHEYESALGLGFKENDTPEFKDFINYLVEKRHNAASIHEVIQAKHTLACLKNNIQDFFKQLVGVPDGVPWARINFLHHLPPYEFAEALSQLPPSEFELACRSLAHRYKNQHVNSYLTEERSWFSLVLEELIDFKKSASALQRYRINRIYRNYFDDPIYH